MQTSYGNNRFFENVIYPSEQLEILKEAEKKANPLMYIDNDTKSKEAYVANLLAPTSEAEKQAKLYGINLQLPKSKFNSGDKVKVIESWFLYNRCNNDNNNDEPIGLLNMTGQILAIEKNKYWGKKSNGFEKECTGYLTDVNGKIISIPEYCLELIEVKPYDAIQCNKSFLNRSDDIDGILLPDRDKQSEFIQRFNHG